MAAVLAALALLEDPQRRVGEAPSLQGPGRLAMPCHATSRHATQRHAAPRHQTPQSYHIGAGPCQLQLVPGVSEAGQRSLNRDALAEYANGIYYDSIWCDSI